MKLHLPLSLRAALLSLFLLPASSAIAGSFDYTTPDYYYEPSSHSNSGTCNTHKRNMWNPAGTTTLTNAQGDKTTYDNYYLFDYQLVYAVNSKHECYLDANGTRHSTTEYTHIFTGITDGGGKDITWNCSTETTPGVWILSSYMRVNEDNPAVFRNYGNMVVDGCRQEYYLVKASGYDSAGNVVYTKTLQNMSDRSLYRLGAGMVNYISDISFDLLVENTESFTFRNGYTPSYGVLVATSGYVTFNNVGTVNFTGNVAGESGIVEETTFTINGANNVIFSNNKGNSAAIAYRTSSSEAFNVSNVSGSVVFSENSANSLFHNYTASFTDVNELYFINNTSRIYKTYNGAVKPVFTNVQKLVISGNTATECLILDDNLDGAKISFYNCGDIIISNNSYDRQLIDCTQGMVGENIKNFHIIGNTAADGHVISGRNDYDYIVFTGIGETFRIDGNSANLLPEEEATSGKYAGMLNGELVVSGISGESGRADLFSMSNNTTTGGFLRCLTNRDVTASNFDVVDISDNDFNCTVSAKALFTGINATNVGDFIINDNTIYGAERCEFLACNITLDDSGSVSVCGNTITSATGRIACLFDEFSATNCQENATVVIKDNSFSGNLGCNLNTNETLDFTLSGAKSLTVENNSLVVKESTSTKDRELVGMFSGNTSITDVENVRFYGNTIRNEAAAGDYDSWVKGGVVCAKLTIQNASKVEFINNTAQATGVGSSALGGAIHTAGYTGYITNCDYIEFQNNKAVADVEACGGAIFFHYDASLVMNDGNGTLIFENNSVTANSIATGGAIYSARNLSMIADTVKLTGNKVTVLADDASAGGGAIYSTKDHTFQDSGTVEICNNGIYTTDVTNAVGGGVYTKGNLTFSNNGSVIVRGNSISDDSHVVLQGLHSDKSITLNTNGENSIKIYDAVYAENYLDLNYESGNTGTIIFSGEYTQTDLAAVSSSYTTDDIFVSRLIEANNIRMKNGVVEVKADMTLCAEADFSQTGGTLRLHNGNVIAFDDLKTTTVEFTGVNCLASGAGSSKLTASAWTLNLSSANLDNAVVNLLSSEDAASGSASVVSLTLAAAEKLQSGVYKLISYDNTDFVWSKLSSATISGICEATSIGTEGESDVYFIVDGSYYTLVYEYSFDSRTSPTTLTWNTSSGIWGNGSGLSNGCWSGSVEDLNYYNGDSVVFASAATVQLSGVLTPASVAVRNTSGNVEWNGTGQLAGATAVTKTGAGTLIINTANAYTGGTSVQAGTLVVGNARALGLGAVALQGGTLDLGGHAVNNDIAVTNDAALTDAAHYTGTLNLQAGKLSVEGALNTTILVNGGGIAGDLALGGGTLIFEFEDDLLNVGGELSFTDEVTIQLNGNYEVGQSYTLITTADGIVGNLDLLDGELAGGNSRYQVTFSKNANDLIFTLSADSMWLNWANAKKAVWQEGAGGWEQGVAFYSGDNVIFRDGTVSIVGEVQPGEIEINVAKSLTFKTSYNKKTQQYSGAIVGDDTTLTIAATTTKGKVTMNDGNRYGGGTTILSGTVNAGGALSFGTGAISIKGGTLDLKSKAVANDIVLDGLAAVKGGKKYEGAFTLNAGELLKGSVINVAEAATLKGGVVNGTLSGGGTVAVSGDVTLGANGKITTNALDIDGKLSVSSKGLAMNSKASAITLNGGTLGSEGKISAYSMTMNGGTLDVTNGKPMGITLKDAFTATSGAEIELYGGLTANQLMLDGVNFTLAMAAADIAPKVQPKAQTITLKGKNLLNTISNSELDIAGKMSVTGDLALTDSSVSLHDVAGAAKPKAQGLTVKGALTTDVLELVTTGAVSAAALTASESVIAIAAEEGLAAQSLKLTRKDVAKGVAQDNILTNCSVYVNGSMSVAGNLQLLNSDIYLRDYSGKNKAQGLTVKGALAVDDSSLSTTGTVSAAALTASESVIAIAAEEGLAAQSLKLTRKDVAKGVAQDNILTNCDVYVNGSMSVAGNLLLQDSYLALRDYSGKKKAMGLSVKGDMVLSSDSYLKLTGALSAKNLTLEGGSSLTLGSAKLSTVKVGGALTLKGEVNFDLGFTVTEKDVAKGKEYTLFSFKSLVGDVSNLTLGYDGEYTLALNTKETAIVLTVKDAAAWNAYVADIQESMNAAPAVADAVATPEEEVEAEELLLKPVAATTDVDPLLAKVADTLVQSTWGTVGASRAFGETIASRGRHASLLDDGRGAAWLSVMGGSSRISTADGHSGADYTLNGAAFGVEGRVGEKNTLGVAVCNSWGKVSTFSAFPVDQDSMHVGIYGNHKLSKSLTLSWMATHTRTESDANILGAPNSWSQDALQLDARLTWGKSLSEKTAVSAFAGLQYLATDSGECAGLKTGSLQNLRAELGVGARRMCSDNTMVFGELSFIGDMVRNNPTATIGDYRTHGTNPGRVGMNLSVGAQHQLSEDWSVNASYSLELMENSTSHSLNVGASYSF